MSRTLEPPPSAGLRRFTRLDACAPTSLRRFGPRLMRLPYLRVNRVLMILPPVKAYGPLHQL